MNPRAVKMRHLSKVLAVFGDRTEIPQDELFVVARTWVTPGRAARLAEYQRAKESFRNSRRRISDRKGHHKMIKDQVEVGANRFARDLLYESVRYGYLTRSKTGGVEMVALTERSLIMKEYYAWQKETESASPSAPAPASPSE